MFLGPKLPQRGQDIALHSTIRNSALVDQPLGGIVTFAGRGWSRNLNSIIRMVPEKEASGARSMMNYEFSVTRPPFCDRIGLLSGPAVWANKRSREQMGRQIGGHFLLRRRRVNRRFGIRSQGGILPGRPFWESVVTFVFGEHDSGVGPCRLLRKLRVGPGSPVLSPPCMRGN